jgi:cytoskeletal protein CcmA (bactofilin family)
MTHIGPSIYITGDVTSDEDLTIHGRVKGRVALKDHTVVIAPDARVEADVRGARVVVLGEVRGSVSAHQRIELGPSATVTGSLSANQVVLIDGARFNGRIDMGQRTIAAKLASYKATHSA